MFNKSEKDKAFEKMKRDGQVATLLNEIDDGRSSSLGHELLNRFSLQERSPSARPFPGEFYSSDDGSFAAFPPFEKPKHQSQSNHYTNGFWVDSRSHDSSLAGKKITWPWFDELGLPEHFTRLNLRDMDEPSLKTRPLHDPDACGFTHSSSPCNVVKYSGCEGPNRSVCDYGRSLSNRCGGQMPCDYGVNAARIAAIQQLEYIRMGGSLGSNLCENEPNGLYYGTGYHERNPINPRDEQESRGLHLQNTGLSRRCLSNGFYWSEQNGVTDRNLLNSNNVLHPKLALNDSRTLLYQQHTRLDERSGVRERAEISLRHRPKEGAGNFQAFACEDSFIMQERSLSYVSEKCDYLRSQRKNSWNEAALQKLREKGFRHDDTFPSGGTCETGQTPKGYFPVLPNSNSLAEFQGYLYFIAKDQQGCRFLQRIFEEGTTQDLEMIFEEIIEHVSELMMNPFGNYLVQKLLEVCSEQQRMQIVHMVTKEPGELVIISLNTHGTRSVQKLIETLKGRQQISQVVAALEPGFLHLIKDLNGNHVVQRCLQCFHNEDNKFIFDAAAKFCVDMATHRHGCCVLQRCVTHSTGEHQEMLVAQISSNGLLLAQDAFGNYVVQYIIELNIPSAAANFVNRFKGNYVQLATQKFSSHVVEKCLKHIEESRPHIIHELLSIPHFEQLLQDPFANYVIQSALEVSKGALRATLVEALRPHITLRTSPYCKRIFSRNLLKK